MNEILNDYAGKVVVSRGKNPREMYGHQYEALLRLNRMSAINRFKGLLVLPTGGGKTFTAVFWVLKNAIDKNKKVLWIAHRHELLNQAKYTIQESSYSDILENKKAFSFRVISGMHDKPINIKNDDDFIIASKDSLNHGFDYLQRWVEHNRNNIVLIIDEAHHAPARSYRKIINLLDTRNNQWFQMLGLTATPLRTVEKEQGILGDIFSDGIIYGIDLKTLIGRKILADPIFEELETSLDISENLTDKDIKSIQAFDSIPDEVAEQIAKNKDRNNLIVNHYIVNQHKYGQMLLFALDINHAITLNTLFNERGIGSEFVVSSIKDMFTHVTISNKENDDKIRRFREGKVNILINVNILTEGTDLPKIQSVFLTRPTISTVLMTQMVGRSLRGVGAGGTECAYIVSFIDNWNDKIAWVNPEILIATGTGDIDESRHKKREYITRLVAIGKMEEFARMMDHTVDTSFLQNMQFIERIPVGIYSFSVLIPSADNEDYSRNCEIIVYDSFKQAYEDFINELNLIFKDRNLNDKEYLDDFELDYLCEYVKKEYFEGYYNPIDYKDEDIKDVLRYYAQKETRPVFLDFENRKEFDLTTIAEYVWNNDLSIKNQKEYLETLWSDEKSFFRIFFGHNKKYFLSQVDLEIHKLSNPQEYVQIVPQRPSIINESIDISQHNLFEVKKLDIDYWRSLVNEVYNKAKDSDGYYHCALSDYKDKSKLAFQIDHIYPMSKGGLTVLDNLQLLARWVNARKSDSTVNNNGEVEESTSFNDTSDSKERGNHLITDLDKVKSLKGVLSELDELDEFHDQDKFLQLCNKAICMYPSEQIFHSKKARLLLNNGNNIEALHSIEDAIEIDPMIEFNHALKGDVLIDHNEIIKAKACYVKALNINPNCTEGLIGIGRIHIEQREYDEALETFESIIQKDARNGVALFFRARIFDMQDKYDEALNFYDEAIRARTQSLDSRFNKACILEDLQKPQEALMLYDEIISLDDQYESAFIRKGKILHENGDIEQALICFNRGIDLLPDFKEAYLNKSIILNEKIENFELAYVEKGDILNEKEDYIGAIDCFNTVLRINEKNVEAYYGRGISFEETKETEAALQDYQKALLIDPNYGGIYFRMAYLLDKIRKYNLAIDYYKKSIELDGDDADTLNNMGYTYVKMKEYDHALRLYNRALKIDNKHKIAIKNKKRLLEIMKA